MQALHDFKKFVLSIAVTVVSIFVVACGDDKPFFSSPTVSYVDAYKSINDLPTCSSELEDSLALVEELLMVFICEDDKWIAYDREVHGDPRPGNNGYDPAAGFLTDSRDGQVYKTVAIGSQVWMAQNLNYRYMEKTNNLDSSSFCYADSVKYCEKYGRLYPWSVAMDSAAIFSEGGKGCGLAKTCKSADVVQGICPEGWHLPSSEEWKELIDLAGGEYKAGKNLKGKSWDGNDLYGFNVLPGGYYLGIEGFYADETANFWTSTEERAYYAYNRLLEDGNDFVNEDDHNKSFALSVRCVLNTKKKTSWE